MRIAVTYEDGQVFQHFGHTEQFKIYDVEDSKIVNAVVVPTNGSGHGALAGFLSQMKVNALICGGIGGGARAALDEAGILLYPGVVGEADAAAAALAAGNLQYNPNTMCQHHHEVMSAVTVTATADRKSPAVPFHGTAGCFFFAFFQDAGPWGGSRRVSSFSAFQVVGSGR